MAAAEEEEVTAEVEQSPGQATESHLVVFINGLNGHEVPAVMLCLAHAWKHLLYMPGKSKGS